MLKTILVPLDGSELAERALPYAETLAGATGAELFLVRAAQARTLPGADPTDAEVDVVEDAEGYLAGVTSRLAPRVRVESAVFYGDPTTAIVEEIGLRSADLVVMATHGRSGLGRWVYGSVAEGVLHDSPAPVLLVRAWHQREGAAALTARPRTLVPLDGSSFAEAVLPMAAGLTRQLAGELLLAQLLPASVVGQGPDTWAFSPDQERVDAREQAEAYLEAVRLRLGAEHAGLAVTTIVREAEPAEGICALAAEYEVAQVAMATHGRTGVARTLLGSVAGGVLRQGRTPLLLVRPAAEGVGENRPSVAEGSTVAYPNG